MPNYGAIDVGTENLRGAILNDMGQPEAVRSLRGETSTPSKVALLPDGKVLIGSDAQEYGRAYPQRFAEYFKMDLGDRSKRYFDGKVTGVDLVAMLTAPIAVQAEKQGGAKVDGYVVTCPANFDDAQKKALMDGLEKAGIKVVLLITEPSAAAYAYAVKDGVTNGQARLILVVDLGGGTLDVSLVEIKDRAVTPIATEGVPDCGGRYITEFTKLILLEKAGKVIGKVIPIEKLTLDQRFELHEKADRAKHALSNQPSTKVALPLKGTPQLVEVTQVELDTACAPLVKTTLGCIDRTMASGKKRFEDVESLVLAGGPFLNQRLQTAVADHTGHVPRVEIDTSLVVVFGAALLAGKLAKEAGGMVSIPEPDFGEITAHDLGIEVTPDGSADRFCSMIVPKKTQVPHVHKPERFRLQRPNQTEVEIAVLQGPDGAPSKQCRRIGEFNMQVPAEAIRSERIEVTFKVDRNMIAEVTAKDLLSGICQTVSVKIPK